MPYSLLWMLVACLGLSACGKWDKTGRAASPDGRAVADIEVKLRGASSSNLTRISVTNASGGTLLEPVEAVTVDGSITDETRLTWDGPDHLRISLCGAAEYRVRSRLLRDPVTRDDGSENAIRVEVENLHYDHGAGRCVRT